MQFVNDRIGFMLRWSGLLPVKLRSVLRQHPEWRPPRVRSFAHGQRAIKLRWEENSFRIWVQDNLLWIKAVNARQIFSRHRVRIVAALAYLRDRNPAMPDPAGLVAQKIESVDKGWSYKFGRSIQQQGYAVSVLRIDREVE